MLLSGCILEGWKGWGTFSPPLSGLDLGAFARRSGGQMRRRVPSGVFFSREPSRAHWPALWSGDCGPEVEKLIPQVAEAWQLREDLPERSCAQEVFEAEATVQPGAAAAPDPGTLAEACTLAGSASARPGAAHGPRSRLTPQAHGRCQLFTLRVESGGNWRALRRER